MPHTYSRQLAATVMLLSLFVASCGGGKKETVADTVDVRGAKHAILNGGIDHRRPVYVRPSAALGIYAGVFMSGGGFFAISGAVQAALAHMKLVGKPSQDSIDTTYALLQEFGSILQVDIADLLNRSPERSRTLDEYITGLRNITARSRQRVLDIDQYVASLQKTRSDLRTQISTIDRDARKALTAKDYMTAGDRQQESAAKETELAKTEAELKQQQSLRKSYGDLLTVADKRVKAIEENREILIAGLKVINVPGAENLGILEGKQTKRTSGGTGLGGLGGL